MTENRKLWIGILIVLVALLVIGLFGFGEINGNSVSEETIRIGAVLPLSGPAAEFGEVFVKGYEWKAEELREKGYNIELIVEDSESNPKSGTSAYNKLVHTQDVDIIFTTLSAVSLSIKPLSEREGVLLWADAAHPDITEDAEFMLRHSNTANTDAKLIAEEIIRNSRGKKVGIFYQNDDWGSVFDEEITKFLENEGIETFSESIDHTQRDFRTSLLKGIDSESEIFVFLAVGPAAGELIIQSEELGFEGEIYSSVGLLLTPSAQKAAGDLLKGTYYQDYRKNQRFDREYKEKFNDEASAFTLVSYTDLELLFYAIEKTGSTDPLTLVSFIKDLGEFEGKYEKVEITEQGDIIIPTEMRVWD